MYMGRMALRTLKTDLTGCKTVKMTAARMVCALVNGLPDQWEGMELVHLCEHNTCINPLHLAWGTSHDNNSRNRNGGYDTLLRQRGGDAYARSVPVAELRRRWEMALGPGDEKQQPTDTAAETVRVSEASGAGLL